MLELELKAIVPAPESVRVGLRGAGAVPGYRGRLEDRRLDRAGELAARDEVLRVRTRLGAEAPGTPPAEMAWKGPTRVSRDGYKARDEIACAVPADGNALRVLRALGYEVVEAIDRFVEYYRLGDAELRLEWYPRMDVLVEVEGTPAAIESAVRVTGLPRETFLADRLEVFAERYRARTGRDPILALSDLAGEAPTPPWPE